MRKKRFLTICAILTGAGMAFACAGIAMGGTVHGIWLDKGGLHVCAPKLEEAGGKKYERREEQVEAFDSVSVDANVDLRIEPSQTDAYTLSYSTYGSRGWSVKQEGGRLTIKQEGYAQGAGGINIAWFVIGDSNPGVLEQDEPMVLRVPKDAKLSEIELAAEDGEIFCGQVQAERIKVSAQYGDIRLSGVQAQELVAETESGRLQMENIQAESCRAESQYGDVELNGVSLSGDMKLKTEEGNIRFEDTRMRSLVMDSEYGDMEGRQTVFADMQVSMESGNCRMEDVLFDHCKINAEYGNVELGLKNEITDYGYELSAEYGDIKIGDKAVGEAYSSLEQNPERMVQIACESGNIRIR